jgi:putative ABC transport system permease protein
MRDRVDPLGAVVSHLRAELRRRWPAWLGAVALIGLVGGLVLGSLAGARRTDTAFDRMLEATNAGDVMANPDLGTRSALDVDDVEALPMVERAGLAMGVAVVPLDRSGQPVEDAAMSLAAGDPGTFVELARPNVIEGRLFDTTTADEIMVTPGLAEDFGYEVGDRVAFGAFPFGDLMAWFEGGEQGMPPMERVELLVAGIAVAPDDVVVDDAFAFETVYFTHAFWQTQEGAFFFGIFADLVDRPGAAEDFQRAVRALVPGEPVEFRTMAALRETVGRGTRPHVVALLAFAAVVGAAGLVVTSQALNRQLAVLAADSARLTSIGMTRRGIAVGAALRIVPASAAGAAVAVMVGAAISPLFPLGVARRAEVSPGFAVDVAVLLPGAVGLAVILCLGSLPSVRRLAQPAASATRASAVPMGWFDTRSLPPVASVGLRMALTPARQASPVSVRSTVMGLGVATAAVVATATFGTNLAVFVDTPRSYGWGWDALAVLDVDESAGATAAGIERFADQEELTGVTAGFSDQVYLDGRRTPALGTRVIRGEAGPPVIAGRPPAGPGEIALGGRTMDALGVGIGDRVRLGAGSQGPELEVVGQAVFIGIGTYQGADRTELGKGALLAAEVLRQHGEGFLAPVVFLEADDPAALQRGIDAALAGSDLGSVEVFTSPLRSADVLNLERVRSTPVVIASVLVVLAAAAFVHSLRSAARARRRDLALLKTLGFQRRQLASTIGVQASTLALAGFAAGLPVGLVGGRWAWGVLASRLGVLPSGRVPVPLLALLVPAVLAVAALAAAGPALDAARTRPASVLRAE